MDHSFYTCHSCTTAFCRFCMGGLKYCTTCGGADDSLTAQCAGVQLTVRQLIEVHGDMADFVDGRWVRYGHLAKSALGKSLPLQILSSAAGFYIGTIDEEGLPVSRESLEYYRNESLANRALVDGNWTQRVEA